MTVLKKKKKLMTIIILTIYKYLTNEKKGILKEKDNQRRYLILL